MTAETATSGSRTAVVTGASSGVGAAISIALGALGWNVAVGARRVDRLSETAAAVDAAGGAGFAHALDVTEPSSIDMFYDAVEARFGVATVLVNNAGLGYLGAIAETTPERIRAVIETNLLGGMLCTRRATAAMLHAGVGGDVVFVSSDSVQTRYPNMIPYGASKAGLEYLAEALDVELAGTAIRSSVVRLGPTVSEFNTGWTGEDMVAFMAAWERLGIKADFNYIPVEAAAQAVVTAVTTPPGTKISLLSIRPEATFDQSERDRWATAASQGRADT